MIRHKFNSKETAKAKWAHKNPQRMELPQASDQQRRQHAAAIKLPINQGFSCTEKLLLPVVQQQLALTSPLHREGAAGIAQPLATGPRYQRQSSMIHAQ